jgi:hypothetical protein
MTCGRGTRQLELATGDAQPRLLLLLVFCVELMQLGCSIGCLYNYYYQAAAAWLC